MIAWCIGAAIAGVRVETPPIAGVETVVVVTDELGDPTGGETVRVIHRPGLARERERAVGITDGRGRVKWTPQSPGIARLQAGDEPLRIRVAHPAPPLGPLLLLGILGLGGAGALGYGVGPFRRR